MSRPSNIDPFYEQNYDEIQMLVSSERKIVAIQRRSIDHMQTTGTENHAHKITKPLNTVISQLINVIAIS